LIKGEVVTNATGYRYCPSCGVEVPAEQRVPRIMIFLMMLMAVSLIATAFLFPRFIFLFIFLPFGFRLWRRQMHCGACGRRLP
jgi:hypothetical protein